LAALPQKKAVVTNKATEFVPPLLAHFEIAAYFDLIVGGNTLPMRKPDPSIVDYVADKLAVAKHEIVVIGDHKTDLSMARDAGIRSVFCEFGIGRDDGIAPTARIRSFSELLEIFR
jgi:phosphoglycolate phosphatase